MPKNKPIFCPKLRGNCPYLSAYHSPKFSNILSFSKIFPITYKKISTKQINKNVLCWPYNHFLPKFQKKILKSFLHFFNKIFG